MATFTILDRSTMRARSASGARVNLAGAITNPFNTRSILEVSTRNGR